MSGDDGRPSGDRPAESGDRTGDSATGGDGALPHDERSVAADTPGPESSVDGRRGSARHDTVTKRERPVAGDDDAHQDRYSEAVAFLRELLTSVAAVVLVGLLLFAISGVWPPMVAVESGSMEPVMHRGDLVFITEPGRYAPAAADETGVVTVDVGRDVGYRSFGGHGSVVVYDQPSSSGSPIIHRAHFWVTDGENWYDRANPDYVTATNCAQLQNCPAPHAGFVTKGDANDRYDQANGISEPVKPEWITGIAQVRVPYLGLIRLSFGTVLETGTHAGGPTVVAAESVSVTASQTVTNVVPAESESLSATENQTAVAGAGYVPGHASTVRQNESGVCPSGVASVAG